MRSPWIIWRYILRDVLFYCFVGLLLATLLLLVQNVLRSLEDLLASGVGLSTVWALILVIVPSYLAYAIPAGLLIGILLSFGRMSADGEIVAFRASGISVLKLMPPVLLLAVVASLITGHLLWQLEPQSRLRMKGFVRELAKSQRVIRPGSFLALGDRLLYVHERGDETCPLRGVLVSDHTDPDRTLYISARCGTLVDTPEGADSPSIGLQFSDGSIHMSDSDERHYRRILFTQMAMSIDLSTLLRAKPGPRDSTFAQLLQIDARLAAENSPDPAVIEYRGLIRIQIQRRLAFPLASVLLAVVAVPLGIRPVRAGRSAGALTAVGLLAAYWCLFAVAETIAEAGYVPAWLAMWTPNAIVACIGVWMIRRTTHSDT